MRPSLVTATLCAGAGLASSTLCTSEPTSVVTLYTTITATAVTTVTGNHTTSTANGVEASSTDTWTWNTFANYSMAILSDLNGTTSAVPITGKLTNPFLNATITTTEDVTVTTVLAADTCTVGQYCSALGSYIDLTTASDDTPTTTSSITVRTQVESSMDHTTTFAAPAQSVQTTKTPSTTGDEIFSSITLTSFVTSTRTLTVSASSAVGIPLLTVSAVPLLSSVIVEGASGPVIATLAVTTSSMVPSPVMEESTVTVTVTGCSTQPVKGASIPKMLVSTGSRVGVPLPIAWLVGLFIKTLHAEENNFSCPENFVCLTSYEFSSTTTVTVWPTSVAAHPAPQVPPVLHKVIDILSKPSMVYSFIQHIIYHCFKNTEAPSKATTSQVNSSVTAGVNSTSSPLSLGAPLSKRQLSAATDSLTNVKDDQANTQSTLPYAGDAPFPPMASYVFPPVTETASSQTTAQFTTTIIVQHTVYSMMNATGSDRAPSFALNSTTSSSSSTLPTAFNSTGLNTVMTQDPYSFSTEEHGSIIHVTITAAATTTKTVSNSSAGSTTATNTNGADTKKYQATSALVVFIFFICLLM